MFFHTFQAEGSVQPQKNLVFNCRKKVKKYDKTYLTSNSCSKTTLTLNVAGLQRLCTCRPVNVQRGAGILAGLLAPTTKPDMKLPEG